jgi:hypothetical protein
MRHPYNPQNFVLMDLFAVVVLVVGIVGVVTTSRWFLCQLCGFSKEQLYRWSAFWPVIMFVAWFFFPHGGGLRYMFAPGIAVAFGLAFSIANLRIPSWYSRSLGAVFVLLHGLLLYALFMELRIYERYLA